MSDFSPSPEADKSQYQSPVTNHQLPPILVHDLLHPLLIQVHARDVFEVEKLHIFIGMDETSPAVDDQLGRHGLRVFFRIFLKAMAAGDPQGMRRRFRHGSSSGKEDVLLPHHHLPAAAIGDKAQLIQRKCGLSQASHTRCLPR